MEANVATSVDTRHDSVGERWRYRRRTSKDDEETRTAHVTRLHLVAVHIDPVPTLNHIGTLAPLFPIK